MALTVLVRAAKHTAVMHTVGTACLVKNDMSARALLQKGVAVQTYVPVRANKVSTNHKSHMSIWPALRCCRGQKRRNRHEHLGHHHLPQQAVQVKTATTRLMMNQLTRSPVRCMMFACNRLPQQRPNMICQHRTLLYRESQTVPAAVE